MARTITVHITKEVNGILKRMDMHARVCVCMPTHDACAQHLQTQVHAYLCMLIVIYKEFLVCWCLNRILTESKGYIISRNCIISFISLICQSLYDKKQIVKSNEKI